MFSSHWIFMLQLWLWLRVCFNLDPEDGGDCMPHGRQNDTFNCGPVTSNTIAHFIFNEPVWNVEKAVHHRVQWFLWFVHAIPLPIEIPSTVVLKDSPMLKEPVTEEQAVMDIDLSIAIAVGDHNFPDLPSFMMEVDDVPPSHPLIHDIRLVARMQSPSSMHGDSGGASETSSSEESESWLISGMVLAVQMSFLQLSAFCAACSWWASSLHPGQLQGGHLDILTSWVTQSISEYASKAKNAPRSGSACLSHRQKRWFSLSGSCDGGLG